MDADASCSLFLCGKSSAENELALSLKNSNVIRHPDDVASSIYLQSEMNRFEDDFFDVALFMNSLSTNQFGRFLIWSPLLTSTHDVISRNFCELPIGVVCVANVQSKGRGRGKNVWQSPRGCLMYSFTIKIEDARVVPLLQYVLPLAVTEALKDVCDRKGLPCLDVKIKWPNDIYLDGLKVGGILCTSTFKSHKFNISAGIGLNVDNETPTTCLNAVLRGLSAAPRRLRKEEILSAFFNKFEKLYHVFINHGFNSLKELYYRTWLHSGHRLILQEEKNDEVVENVVTIRGLTSSGYLLAIGDDRTTYELHPDGNSLDFFMGMIRRKL